jgi:hypothetical protein
MCVTADSTVVAIPSRRATFLAPPSAKNLSDCSAMSLNLIAS